MALKRNNMKQTAVEWLIQNIVEDQTIKAKSMSDWIKIFKQSKEMEKQQIVDAYDKGEFNQGCNGDAEQYYKETFKQD